MACCCVAITAVLVIIALLLVDKIRKWRRIPSLPFLEETWWGPRSQAEEDTEIKPFAINVSDEVLTDLQHRLKNSRTLTPPLEGIQHEYGMNTNLLQEIVEYWQKQYNWKERQLFLNKFPQFTVSVQGLRLHYLHVKPTNPDNLKVYPLLLLHGWPGSVCEFYKMIPLLTTPQSGRKFVFEVIVPSLPGYGFSEAAVRPGLGGVQVAVLLNNLMKRLDFEKYYVQGGDWGSVIGTNMATIFPEHVIGFHTNFSVSSNTLWNITKLVICSYWPTLLVREDQVHKVYPLSTNFINTLLETGYSHLQATKPDTVGVGLNDSPVGLAAYILEKFITWTNPDWKKLRNGLTQKYNYDELLDNIMIYWITNSITTSMRLYAETINTKHTALGIHKIPTAVPTAFARFVNDIFYSPTSFLKDKYLNIVHTADYNGGHFSAFEEPQLLAEDIYTGIEKIQLFYQNA